MKQLLQKLKLCIEDIKMTLCQILHAPQTISLLASSMNNLINHITFDTMVNQP